MDNSELRAVLANAIRAHTLLNGRCEACGERATHQSLHQADVLLTGYEIAPRTPAECECHEPACQWCEVHGDTGRCECHGEDGEKECPVHQHSYLT